MPSRNEFDKWLEEYHDMIYATIYRMTRNEDDASDLTQDVFLRAYKKRKSFRGESSPGTWLTRIALNLTYNFLKRNKSGKWQEMKEEEHKAEQKTDFIPVSFDKKHLEILSPLENSVVSARIYGDLPYKQIAEILNSSENSVKVAWSKAVKKLRKVVKK